MDSLNSMNSEIAISALRKLIPVKPASAGKQEDVDFLVAAANYLRDRRLKTPFPDRITEEEKRHVKQAARLEPQSPFVILALLDILSSKKKNISEEFETTCRALMTKYPGSTYILLRIAKYFLQKGRNPDIAIQCIRNAINVSPSHHEANFLAAKYLSKLTNKAEVGTEFRDSFYKVNLSDTDMTNPELVLEYFLSNFLGGRNASSTSMSLFDHAEQDLAVAVAVASSSTASAGASATITSARADSQRPGPSTSGGSHSLSLSAGAGMAAIVNSRYNMAIDMILSTRYSKAWPKLYRSKIQLVSAFTYYVREDYAEALELLLDIYKDNRIVQTIRNLDKLCVEYGWDSNLMGFDKFRRWIVEEYEDIVRLDEEDRMSDNMSTTSSQDLFQDCQEELNDSKDYVNENCQLDEDPIKEMLAYLIQVL